MAATGRKGFRASQTSRDRVIMVMDVSRAFFYAPIGKLTYVEIPAEEGVDTEKYCGRLNYSLYGTREAPQNWHQTYSGHLQEIGFKKGVSSPCIFRHPIKHLSVVVHGDDYVVEGRREDAEWLEKEVRRRFEIKTEYLGPRETDKQEVKVLNRIMRYTEHGIEFEADPRQHEIILHELSLTHAKGLTSPGVKNMPKEENDDNELSPLEATKYRAICARVNYLALDRPDLMYSAKECSRSMSSPTRLDWRKLKRIGRYLIYRPRMVVKYLWQGSWSEVTGNTKAMLGFSDSDWAGCQKSRGSTSGGAVQLGGHWIKAWSRTQATVALSSAEAELYAMIKTSSEVLGIISILKDLGVSVKGEILGDASACLAVIQRQGLGKMRHIDTGFLWVQEKSARKELTYGKVHGKWNPADLLTKYLCGQDVDQHSQALCTEFRSGRALSAPKLIKTDSGQMQVNQVAVNQGVSVILHSYVGPKSTVKRNRG
eukprot:5474387-Karenia_brevis.AAC.1